MLRRKPLVEEAPLQNELMLFDPETSQFFVLNRTMAFLWRNWDEQKSLDDLAAGLEVEFEGANSADLAGDLQSAVSELRQLGLLLD